jgi:hypothetical protein
MLIVHRMNFLQKVQSLESLLNECLNFVTALEREASAWRQNTGTSLGLTQLQLEYSQVKVRSKSTWPLRGDASSSGEKLNSCSQQYMMKADVSV